MKLSRRVLVSITLALVMVATVLIGAISVSAARPTEAIGTIEIFKGENFLDANNYGIDFFATNGGHIATCVEADKKSPKGVYSYGVRTDENAKYLIACLLTAPMTGKGGGVNVNPTGTDANPIGSYPHPEFYQKYYTSLAGTTEGMEIIKTQDVYYFMAHFVAAYINGTTPNNMHQQIYKDEMEEAVTNVRNWADNNADTIGKYRLYATMPEDGSDKQSLIWIERKPDSKGAVAIKKTNESGDVLAGVKIGIYSDPGAQNLLQELVTDENGIAYYGYDGNAEEGKKFKLTLGDTYYFKEIEQPKMDENGNEYYLSEEIVPVKVVEPKDVKNGIAEGNIAYGYLENFFKERLKTKAFFDNEVKEGVPSQDTRIIDQVECSNLKIGKEYTIKGALYDVDNPNNVLATGETTFTATEKNMFVEVEFLFDASKLEGKTVVVFEDLYKDGIKVATHSELTDKGQQVSFPKIVTSVGTSTITADMDATITDTLSYTNLTPGKSYVIEGVIMDKDTGEIALSNGEEIRATAILTPETENGQVDVVFAFDASKMAGKTLVVFEEVYDEEVGELIGEHKDLNDTNQTFTVVDGPAEKITTNLENDDEIYYGSPKTGYEDRIVTWLLLGVTAVVLMITCMAVMIARRNKEY